MPSENQLVIFQHGEYSDFCYHGPFRANKTFSLKEKFEEWVGVNPPVSEFDLEDKHEKDFGFMDFVAWLNQQGYITDESVREFYLGAYCRYEPYDWD